MVGKKRWNDRLQVMELLGWSATKEEWPHFLASLRKECCLDELSEFLGFDIPTIMRDMLAGGYKTVPRQRLFVDGVPLKEYAKRHGVNYDTMWRRLKKGLPLTEDSRAVPRVVVDGKTILEHAAEKKENYQAARRRLQGRYDIEKRKQPTESVSDTKRTLQKNCPEVKVNRFNKDWKRKKKTK